MDAEMPADPDKLIAEYFSEVLEGYDISENSNRPSNRL
jgi:hypothetical protein